MYILNITPNRMTNLEKYNEVFKSCFQLDETKLVGLTYQSVESWDSVGHMGLIAALEDSFDIMMDTDDIIDFSSYEKGKEIMLKYGINF
jgi:acyl carrier protein